MGWWRLAALRGCEIGGVFWTRALCCTDPLDGEVFWRGVGWLDGLGWLDVACWAGIGSWLWVGLLLSGSRNILQELVGHLPRVWIHVLIATDELGRVSVDVHGPWVVGVGGLRELRGRFWSRIGRRVWRSWEESLYLGATGRVEDGQGRAGVR